MRQVELARYQREKKEFYAAVHWYAVYVTPGHEFQIYDYLMGLDDDDPKNGKGGSADRNRHRAKAKREDVKPKIDKTKIRLECFVPATIKHVKYSDRMVWKEKIQTPGIIFVHTQLDNRDELFHSRITEYVTGFINDRDKHRPLPIPDSQMIEFMAVIADDYDAELGHVYEVGDKVLVLEGALQNHIAELVEKRESLSKEYQRDDRGMVLTDSEGNPIYKRKVTLCIRLNAELAATFEIDADKVVPAPKDAADYVHYD